MSKTYLIGEIYGLGFANTARMINWLAVIGIATSIIAICLLALIGGLIFTAFKLKGALKGSIDKVHAILGQVERMGARVERRVAGIDDFVTSAQDKVSSVVSKIRSVIRRILEGLHIAKKKEDDIEPDDLEEDWSDNYAEYEYDRRPGNQESGQRSGGPRHGGGWSQNGPRRKPR